MKINEKGSEKNEKSLKDEVQDESQNGDMSDGDESDSSRTTEVRLKETDKHGEMVLKEKEATESLLMIEESPLR